jgi:hypothetical protein
MNLNELLFKEPFTPPFENTRAEQGLGFTVQKTFAVHGFART